MRLAEKPPHRIGWPRLDADDGKTRHQLVVDRKGDDAGIELTK
jgi:hypothetical protein